MEEQITLEEKKFFILTLTKNGFGATDIHRLIENAWGDIITVRRVQQIVKEFHDGKFDSFKRREGSGRPRTSATQENVEDIRGLIEADKSLSLTSLSMITDIPKSTIQRILTQELQKISVQAKWVPYDLSETQKQTRVSGCKEIRCVTMSRNIRKRLFVTDEKWIYARHLPSLSSTRTWVDFGGDRPTVARRMMRDKKFLWLMAANFHGDAYFEILNPGETVNAERYLEFLSRLFTHFHITRPILMHDNARPHVARTVQNWLEEKNINLLRQPPYSPDLNLMDRYIFRNFETFRGLDTLSTKDLVEEKIRDFIATFTPEEFSKQFTDFVAHVGRVIESGGTYL